jgi:mRNA interferase YafQ
MKVVSRTSQFKRDVKRMQRQGKDLKKLREVLEFLVKGESPPDRHRDHVLVGQYKFTRECHLDPDRLLIYELAKAEIILIRTGSNSDLFA